MADAQETDRNIEIWKIKKLIKALQAARGNGTSMISLIMPPRDQISRVAKMLGDEYGTASNIKSRVNRQSVLGAITSAQQRLKLYNKVPPNGLVLYTGTIVTDDGKEKKVTIDFEPFKPINASLYLCDNKFHIEALNELLESDDKFGSAVGPARTAAGGGKEGAIVEYRPVMREEEEDLEVKLRRIIENVPVRVGNTSGSSAGSGSGDFHQYRQMRRKEQDRLSRMDADYQRRKEIAEFNMRREERLKAAEERTAKKRLKRQKKKQKKKEKKSKTSGDGEEEHHGEENHKEESSDNEDSDYNDDELKP